MSLFCITDEAGIFLDESPYPVKGHGDVAGAAPAKQPGKLSKWGTELDRNDPKYGDPGTGSWLTLVDHRQDELYMTDNGNAYTVGETVEQGEYPGYGDLPPWLTTTARPSQFHNWVGGVWVLDVAAELADIKAKKIAGLYADCQAQILVGFESSALGSAHGYPSAALDQQNMVQTATNSDGGSFMCSDAGTWALVAHTQAQAQTVLADFVTARDAARGKLQTLTAAVNDAADKAAVADIVWNDD